MLNVQTVNYMQYSEQVFRLYSAIIQSSDSIAFTQDWKKYTHDKKVHFNLKEENKKEKPTETLHLTVEMTGSSKKC